MVHNSLWTQLRGKLKTANRRLLGAMVCYAVLLAIALYALLPARSSNECFLVGMVLLVFALLIVKTLAHAGDENSD
jgi:integral membrane sensor domain MASE1